MTSPATARELIPTAASGFGERVHRVGSERWSAATPCSEWTVRDLVNHLTSEHLWAPHLLRGERIQDVGDRYDGDVLGDDPVAAWDAAVARSLPAFAAAGDSAIVHLSYADVPVREYAEQMLVDLTVHAWDLARGAGLDDRLDPTAVEHVLDYASGVVGLWRSAGLFSPEIHISTPDPQDRLLGLLGRRP